MILHVLSLICLAITWCAVTVPLFLLAGIDSTYIRGLAVGALLQLLIIGAIVVAFLVYENYY